MFEKSSELFIQTSSSRKPQIESSCFSYYFGSSTSISKYVSEQDFIIFSDYFIVMCWIYEFSDFTYSSWLIEPSLFSKWFIIPSKSLWCFIIFWWWLRHWSADLVFTYLLNWRKTFSSFLLYRHSKSYWFALIKSRNLWFSNKVHLFELH
jgi:hypothetical protein